MSESPNPYASPVADTDDWVQSDSSSLRYTKLGLSLVYYGIVVLLLSLIFSFLGPLALRAGGAAGLSLIGVAVFGVMIGAFLIFVGPLFCLTVPAETGARDLILGSVVFQFGNVIQAVLQRFAPHAISVIAGLVLNVSGLIGAILFVLFMRKLAQFIRRGDLADRASRVLIGVVVVAILAFVLLGGMFAGFTVTVLLGFVLLIGGLIVFVMYANLVNVLRKALVPTSASS